MNVEGSQTVIDGGALASGVTELLSTPRPQPADRTVTSASAREPIVDVRESIAFLHNSALRTQEVN